MPEGKPTLIGEDGRRAAADARRRHRIGVGAEAGRAMRLPVQPVGRGRKIDRRSRAPLGARRIGEVEIAERPRLRPIMPAAAAFDTQPLLVLMLANNILKAPAETVGRPAKRRRMPFGTYPAAGHKPPAPHAPEPHT